MNRLVKTFFPLIILGTLSLVYYYDTKKKETNENLRKETASIFKFNPKDIGAMEICSSGDIIYIEKDNDGNWQMLKPLKDRGDEEVIEGILERLKEIKSLKEITPSGDNLSAYGLDNPSISFKLYGNNGDNPLVSAGIGLDSIITSAVYVKVENDPVIHYVTDRIKTILKRVPYELRNKKLITIPSTEVEEIEFQRGENKFIIKKTPLGWSMNYPYQCRSSESIIFNNISLINSILIKKFVGSGSGEEDLKRYNLYSPEFLFRAVDKNKNIYEVKISKVKDERGVYLFSNSREGIYYSEDDILPKLPKKELDLRQRRVLPVYIHDMGEVKLENKRGEITFKEDESRLWWGYIKEKKYILDPFTVQRLFAVATGIKAESFINDNSAELSDYGLNPPLGAFTAFDKKGNKLGRLLVGKLNKEGIKAYCMNEDYKEIAIIDMVWVRDWFGREPEFFVSKTENGEKNEIEK